MEEPEKFLTTDWKGTKLTAHNASGFVATVETLAKKAGMAKTPDVFLLPNLPGYGANGITQAACIAHDKIIVTESMLKLFESENLHSVPHPELQAILGHEMSHCKFGASEVRNGKWPLLILPAAAVTGMYIYNTLWKNHAQSLPQERQEALNTYTSQLHAGIQKAGFNPEFHQAEQKAKQDAIDIGKYFAAAALGLIGGIALVRHFHIAKELRADQLGAKVSTPEAMAGAIKKINTAILEHFEKGEVGGGNPSKWKEFKMNLLEPYPTIEHRIENVLR